MNWSACGTDEEMVIWNMNMLYEVICGWRKEWPDPTLKNKRWRLKKFYILNITWCIMHLYCILCKPNMKFDFILKVTFTIMVLYHNIIFIRGQLSSGIICNVLYLQFKLQYFCSRAYNYTEYEYLIKLKF